LTRPKTLKKQPHFYCPRRVNGIFRIIPHILLSRLLLLAS
jgi:hypothetical protein